MLSICARMNRTPGLAMLMHSTARLLAKRIEGLTRDSDLTSAQWRLVVTLRKNGPMRQARLAEFLEIEPISASRLATRTQAAGWIERVPDPSHKGAWLISLTERASRSLTAMSGTVEGVYADLLDGIPDDQIQTFMQVMRQMNDRLSDPDSCANDDVACTAKDPA